MRRRLIGTSLAVTSMVVLAFLVPLGLLVRDLAHDRALSAAEREAEGIARFLAVVGPERGIDQAVAALGDPSTQDFEVSLILPDGSVVGPPLRPGEDLSAASQGSTVRVTTRSGEAIYVPILQSDGSVVIVRVFADASYLTRGVRTSWMTLSLLGLLLVAIAVLVSDRLARSIVTPVEQLSATAAALGTGNLDARVVPAGPKEIHDVGAEFNRLAERVEQLLQQERETAADLSHQLRTPLTAVRLNAEALPDGSGKVRLLDDIDQLSRHVDFVIREARREVRRTPGIASDLALLARERLAFWEPLAEEQGRTVTVTIEPASAPVALPADDVDVMLDALVGNVFAHTRDGDPIRVTLLISSGTAVLTLEDGGPGFPDQPVLERGMSGGGGTGLGLDIVRRTVESASGTLLIGRSSGLGGASVTVSLPITA